MSIDKLKNQIGDGIGILNGLGKNSEHNNNNNQNHNSNHNRNDNQKPNIEDKVKELKNKNKKRKIKNSTYGLYEDQIESIQEIASALDMKINEFMRYSQDMMIDLFKKELDI